MNQDLLNKLYSLIQTTEDVANLNDAVQYAKNNLFKIKNKAGVDEISLHLPVKFGMFLKEAVIETKTDPSNLTSLKSLLSAVSESLNTLEEVSLTLAIDPSQKTLDKLSDTLKKTFGINSVMSISIDPDILGGAIVILNGRYLDYSLRKKLNIVFEARKDEIAQVMNQES